MGHAVSELMLMFRLDGARMCAATERVVVSDRTARLTELSGTLPLSRSVMVAGELSQY
jgi:hypothetical protein